MSFIIFNETYHNLFNNYSIIVAKYNLTYYDRTSFLIHRNWFLKYFFNVIIETYYNNTISIIEKYYYVIYV